MRASSCHPLRTPRNCITHYLTRLTYGLSTANAYITDTLKRKLTFFGAKQVGKKTLNSHWLCEHQLIKQQRHQPGSDEFLRQAADSVQQKPAGEGGKPVGTLWAHSPTSGLTACPHSHLSDAL